MNYVVSVIVPALNEEQNIVPAIENIVQAFQRLSLSGEIVVINDGSTDRTGDLVENLRTKYNFLKVVHHPKPRGIGGSFWAGVFEAQGEVVTLAPGDGENDAYEILRYLPLMEQVDIVVPFVFNKECRSHKRRFVSALYRSLMNLSFGTSLNYLNGTVIYRRTILRNFTLESTGFFYQTELLVKSLRAGYLYAEVPYGLKRRNQGESKAVSLRSLQRITRDYFKLFSTIHFSKGMTGEIDEQSISARRMKAFQVYASKIRPLEPTTLTDSPS